MTLVIKYDLAADTGERPLGAGTVFWTSQSIRLLHPDAPGLDDASTLANVPTTIEVRVSNQGRSSVTGVRVEAYIFRPGTAFTPSQAIVGPFTGVISGDIAGNSSGVAEYLLSTGPWLPSVLAEGHCCVCTNTWLDDGIEGAPLGQADPFQVTTNPHHGQRNINVVAMELKIIPGTPMAFRFNAINPNLKEEETFVLTVQEVRGSAAIGRAERALIRSGQWAEIKPLLARTRLRGLGFVGGEIEQPTTEARLHLKPGEAREMELLAYLNPREEVGSTRVFDIVQYSQRGVPVGGVRVLSLVVPDA